MWSINQLDLKNVKQVNLEKVWNINFKSKTSRLMSHWTNTLIRDKLKSVCEFRTRVAVVQWEKRNKELQDIEKKLNALMSEDARTANELADLEKLL